MVVGVFVDRVSSRLGRDIKVSDVKVARLLGSVEHHVGLVLDLAIHGLVIRAVQRKAITAKMVDNSAELGISVLIVVIDGLLLVELLGRVVQRVRLLSGRGALADKSSRLIVQAVVSSLAAAAATVAFVSYIGFSKAITLR
jgi:hypothetical protein